MRSTLRMLSATTEPATYDRALEEMDALNGLCGAKPHLLKDLWVARAVELAQRQHAITHALIKPIPNGKPVRMGASVVTYALTERVQ